MIQAKLCLPQTVSHPRIYHHLHPFGLYRSLAMANPGSSAGPTSTSALWTNSSTVAFTTASSPSFLYSRRRAAGQATLRWWEQNTYRLFIGRSGLVVERYKFWFGLNPALLCIQSASYGRRGDTNETTTGPGCPDGWKFPWSKKRGPCLCPSSPCSWNRPMERKALPLEFS